MNLPKKRKIILSIGSLVSRNMRIVILLLQINIICLAQEDLKLKLIGETDSRDLAANYHFPSGNDDEFIKSAVSPSIERKTSSVLYNDNSNIRGYNVISDAGNHNNDPFVNMYLNHNAPPLALPQVHLSYSVQQNKSSYLPKNNPNEYTIGGVLSGKGDIDHHFIQTLNNLEIEKFTNKNVTLNNAIQNMDTNPIKTAITVCSQLIERKVYAIIVSKPRQGDLSPASVSYTAGFYHIPVIGISSRDSAFSDKNIHVSFLRTLPPYSHQADVWVEMLKKLKYRQLVFIHSSDTDGRALLGRFQTKITGLQSDDQEVKVEKIEEFEPGNHRSYKDMLRKIQDCQARVYFLYGSAVDANKIFQDAKDLKMTGEGYVWIVTEQALAAENVPLGTLGLRLQHANDERKHIHDSLYILAQALLELHGKENVTQAPSNCNKSGAVWLTGKLLFEYIRKQILSSGKTGRVAFDEMGDRMFAEYEIINIQKNTQTKKQHQSNKGVSEVPVGSYKYDKREKSDENGMVLKLENEKIIWPGETHKKPSGLMIPTHLQVLTINEKPFVYSRQILPCDEEPCDQCNPDKQEIPCPIYNTTHLEENGKEKYCCYGYCIDLLVELAKECNFTYDLHLSKNEYGALTRNNRTEKQEWNGLIGELVKENAALIVAPLTINPERAQVMEFSKPFKYQGITILQKRQPRASQLVSFLQPFKSTLWVLVLVSVHVVAICLYLLDRFSPFGRFHTGPHASGSGARYSGPNGEIDTMTVSEAAHQAQKEESLNLTSAVWFAWGVLLNAGIGEGTPRSFSARVLGMVWAGFAMIIVASYTANLAAFLVLDKPQTSLTGINDPRLRNPMENFTYATVRDSSVDTYFRRQVELSNMYRTMEGKHYENPDQAIEAVKNDELKAFIWDSSRLEYEAARSCHLITAGDLFGRSGYGVGLQKGSPWADKVTLAILDFHESGLMEGLDNKWILLQKEQDCDENDDNSPATLGLENMRGVFILVGVGIVGGLGLIVIEIIYKKHQMKKKNKTNMARVAIEKWRGTLQKRRTLAETKETKKRMKANGMRMGSSSGGMPLIGGGAGTPESITLSVDSLPQRQMYQGEAKNVPHNSNNPTWRRSPIIDVTNNSTRRTEHPLQQYAVQQQYRPSAPEVETIGYTHDQRQRIPNLQKRQKSMDVIMSSNISRPKSAMSQCRSTVASREAGTLSAPDDDDEEWDRVIGDAKLCSSMSREKMISGAHSQSASHLKSLSKTNHSEDTILLQQNRNSISIGSGLPGLPRHSEDSDNNICYHQHPFEPSTKAQNNENRDYASTYPEEITTANYGDGQIEQYNIPRKQKQHPSKIQHLSKVVKSPLPTNNLPPHKQHKLYKKHMSASSSTPPPLYSRSSKDSVIIVHPNSQRKYSNTSSLEDEEKSKHADSPDIHKEDDVKDDRAQHDDNFSDPNEEQMYDARPHLITSNLSTSGAPPQFWADSSCHEDDPPSQMSGMNINLSIASSTSGGVTEQNPTPPPVPPHRQPNITSPPSTLLPSEQIALSRKVIPRSEEHVGKSIGYRAHFKSIADRREDEDASSPDYTSLSTSSVDKMRQQIPNPPPPPKLYYHMRSNLTPRPSTAISDGPQNIGMLGKAGGGKQKQYKQQPHVYYGQHQQRPYQHRAREFVSEQSTPEMRYNPLESERQRSVQSQIGGGGSWQHHQQSTKGGSSSSALKGVKHNSERYLIQATDGSRANIQQQMGSNSTRKRHTNMPNSSYNARYMVEDSDL